jgi:hypothetical protein
MFRSRAAKLILPITLLLVSLSWNGIVPASSAPKAALALGDVRVTLSAPRSTTSWDQRDSSQQKFELPLLTLHRERHATPEMDRTLEVKLVDLAGGTPIWVEIVSQHVDVSTGEQHRETRSFATPNRPCTPDEPCTLQWTLDAATMPSDFYYLHVKDRAGNALWEKPYPERPDFVTLDTWDVGLDDYTARIYYATLFPFARGRDDLDNRLSPAAVTDFVEGQFAPIIQDTWQVQIGEWGFGHPLHPDWDQDKVIEIVVNAPPFALFDGEGTYVETSTLKGNRPYLERRVWWRSSLNNFAAYETLGDAYRAGLAHEFFHLMQWNVQLGGERPMDSWLNVFVEAQAQAAVSIQYPELELGQDGRLARHNEYARAANRFLAERLNSSYRDLDAHPTERYDAALYWRFLYESFNDTAIFRVALEEMAAHYDADILRGMETVMDRALARTGGPFHTSAESLVAFARANYALRLENGRCTTSDLTECGSLYYDPDQIYVDPPLEAVLDYDGARMTYNGALPSSYGMDFIDVRLDPTTRDQALTIRFQGEGEVARFNVQVWKVGPGAWKPRAVTEQPEIVPDNPDGAHVYVIPSLDTEAYDRLALIITRLDAEEMADPVGDYRVTLESTGVSTRTVLSSK